MTGRHIDEDSLDAVPFSKAAQTSDHALVAAQAESASRLLGFNRATVSAAGKPKAFDYPRSDLPPHVHYVGPLTSSGPPSSTDTDWKALAAGRPIVVLTQGTVADQSDTLVEPGLRALAKEDVFVVAVGTSLAGQVPANARHVPYLSYEEILPLASAMVTNGGYGGVQIALSHGVPLAVAGATEDKPEVAARVAWTGAGINLRTASPTEAAIADAVRRLLTDHDIRRNARGIADDYARHNAPQRAADLLDGMVSPGPTRTLRHTHDQRAGAR